MNKHTVSIIMINHTQQNVLLTPSLVCLASRRSCILCIGLRKRKRLLFRIASTANSPGLPFHYSHCILHYRAQATVRITVRKEFQCLMDL